MNDALNHHTSQAVQLSSDPRALREAVNLAMGRIFRLGSRPTQESDIEDYDQCRALILTIMEGRAR